MKAQPLLAVALLIFAADLPAQEKSCFGKSSLVYADTISFFLDAPTGWVLDCNAGKSDGPLTVLYRSGETWRTGAVVMYANVLTRKAEVERSFLDRVNDEVADWKARAPDAVVTVGKSIAVKTGRQAATRRFDSTSKGLHEIVAYIPRGKAIPILVMTGRSRSAFEEALPAFESLVRSYAPGPRVQPR